MGSRFILILCGLTVAAFVGVSTWLWVPPISNAGRGQPEVRLSNSGCSTCDKVRGLMYSSTASQALNNLYVSLFVESADSASFQKAAAWILTATDDDAMRMGLRNEEVAIAREWARVVSYSPKPAHIKFWQKAKP